MIRAKLRLSTPSARASESLVRAVEPDNGMPGLTVVGQATRWNATFRVSFEGKIETFISTLDDLIQCLQAAEGTLNTVSKRNRK